MQTPEYVGSSAARMIAALTAFLLVVGAFAWWLAAGPRPARNAATAQKSEAAPQVSDGDADSGAFFYLAIGTTTPVAYEAPKAGQKLSYTLEIKVTRDRNEAETLIDVLAKDGVEAYFTPLSRQGQVVYRVRRGVFPTQRAAAAAQLALKEEHKLATRVVKLQ
jgi:hypothetical protein